MACDKQHKCLSLEPGSVRILTDELTCSALNLKRASAVQAEPQVTLGLLKRLVADFPPRRPGFNPKSTHVRFVVDKVALGQVSPVNLYATNCSTITLIYHLGQVQ
jgi:hypothetical protein